MTDMAQELAVIATRYGVRDVYAFGSRALEVANRLRPSPQASASGNVGTSPLSDLDVAIQPLQGRRLSARDLVRLTDDLERLFQVPRVDLVVLGGADPLLAVEVVRGELLHTSDPLAQAEQELYVLRRAADLAPFREERVRQVLGGKAR